MNYYIFYLWFTGMLRINYLKGNCCSVAQSSLTLCNPMDCSMPGFPVLYYLPESAQTCSLTQWWHPVISSSIALLLLLPSIFLSIRVFSNESALDNRWPKYWSFSFSKVLPTNIQSWYPLGLVWSPCCPRDSQESSPAPIWKHQFLGTQPSLWSNTHIHTLLLEKPLLLTTWTFVSKMTSLLFNRLSRFVIAFLPRSKCLLISWLQSPSVVILETKKIKSVTVSIFFPSTCHEVMGPDAMILVFWMLSLKPAFSLTLSLSRGSSVPLPFCH